MRPALEQTSEPNATPPHERVPAWALERASRWLSACIVALSALFLLLFLYAAYRRLRYPFEVEWIESGMAIAVMRLLHGQPLYTAPTLDYTPYLYAPLYFYVSAFVARFTSTSMMALRLVSVLSTLGSCGVIFAFVYTEGRRKLPAVAAAGLYVACYAIAAQFFDIGRVDAMFVFLLLLALLAQRRGHVVLAAVCWALTLQTKQTVLPIAVFILCAEWQRPRRMVAGLATFAGITAVTMAWINHATGGWYLYFLFKVAGSLLIVWRQVALFLPHAVMAPFGVALVVIVASLLLRPPRLRSGSTSFYLFVTVALVGGIWFVAGHGGASANAFLPVYAWVAIVFGVALSRSLEADASASLLTTGLLAATVVQLLALLYNPGQYIPTAETLAARRGFVAQLQAIPGKVFLVDHSLDAVLAGRTPNAEGEAYGAIVDLHRGTVSLNFDAEFKAAYRNHAYTAVVVDGPAHDTVEPVRDAAYPLAVQAVAERSFTLTSQPHWILFPCESEALARSLQPQGLVDTTHCPHAEAKAAGKP